MEYSDIHKKFKEYDYEERHCLLVNGETSVVKEEFRMTDDTMLNRKPFILIPKLRGQFAEFLNNASPDGLRILFLTTCDFNG